MGDFCQRHLGLSFIFKNDNYYQWSITLRGNSLGTLFWGVNYPEGNYSGRQLSGEAIIWGAIVRGIQNGYHQDFQYLMVSIHFFMKSKR